MLPHKVPLCIVAAAILTLGSGAEGSRVLTHAASSLEVESTWGDWQEGKTCYDHRLHQSKTYKTPEKARKKCEQEAQCSGVYDYHGNGDTFYLCKKGHDFEDTTHFPSKVQPRVSSSAGVSVGPQSGGWEDSQ